jgi:hypothetical protein
VGIAKPLFHKNSSYEEVDGALICSSTVMVLGRQHDYRCGTIIQRLREWRTVSLFLARQRILFRNPSSYVIYFLWSGCARGATGRVRLPVTRASESGFPGGLGHKG